MDEIVLERTPRTGVCPPAVLRNVFDAVVSSAQPASFLGCHVPQPPRGRTIVVGAGKAAGAMAAALEDVWDGPLDGCVVTRYGHACSTRHIQILQASHPVPDASSVAASYRLEAAMRSAGPDDLVLCLISGGGSSLLCRPAPGLSLHDKQAVNQRLLASGASIADINCVRKHLSDVKGGRLASWAGNARVVSLIMSDVPGDDPADVASGPTTPDLTTLADARDVLRRHRVEISAHVEQFLANPVNETPKPDDPSFERVENRVVLTPAIAFEAGIKAAERAGYEVVFLGADLEGDAADLGAQHAALALDLLSRGRRVCILSGGETTVQVRASGRGGRNAQYLLALAIALRDAPGIHALAADTDGIDGTEDNAGALIGPGFLAAARRAGVDPEARLVSNDAYPVFEATGNLLVTGPTQTNVNDLRAILVDPPLPDHRLLTMRGER